jgi:hypothetical protein
MNSKASSGRKASSGDQVQVLHILVKHTGSRNPKNYKGETITRSKTEARQRLDGLYMCINIFPLHVIYSLIDIIDELNSADDLESTFRRIAKDKSDCSSGQRGGKFCFIISLRVYV